MIFWMSAMRGESRKKGKDHVFSSKIGSSMEQVLADAISMDDPDGEKLRQNLKKAADNSDNAHIDHDHDGTTSSSAGPSHYTPKDLKDDSANVMKEEDSANDVHKVDSANDVKAIPREASICSVGRHPACRYPA